MKICIISPRYTLTGVALAQIRFARALAQNGHEVDLIFGCLDYEMLSPDKRQLPDVIGVKVAQWGCDKVRKMFSPMVRYLRKRKPDIVFSAEDHLNDVVLLAAIASGSQAKISGSSRVLPVDAVGHGGPYSNTVFSRKWVFKQLTRAVMWRADALTCVSEDMVGEYRKLFGNSPHVCVYNIIADAPSLQRMVEPVDDEWFLSEGHPIISSAGTLTKRKGFTDLIHAVRHLYDRNRPVRLAILGEGPMRQELEHLVQELDLEDAVWFAGLVENPLKYFARSQVSVLASYSEGLPNVLVEAMMCGCVPVATDCPTGPREVLQDGKYGYLVPMHDPAAMATGIEMALDKKIPAELLAEAVQPFKPEAVIRRHFEILGLAGHESALQ
jgi:glycosyltransferase involved in cell wall biosynthesis